MKKNYTIEVKLILSAKNKEEAHDKLQRMFRRNYINSSDMIVIQVGEPIPDEFKEDKKV